MPKSGTKLLVKAVESLGVASFQASQGALRRWLARTPFGPPPFLSHRSAKARAGRWATQSRRDRIPIGVLSPVYVESERVRSWLAAIGPGQYISGHVPYSRSLAGLLLEQRWKMIYIVREPRAVLSSFLHYVIQQRKRPHILQRDFAGWGPEKQIEFALEGGFAPIANIEVRGMVKAYETVLGWESFEDALKVRFEDLIGEKGGGDAASQEATWRALAGHLEIALDPSAQTRIDAIFDTAAPTFRLGQVDSWRSEFTASQREWLEREFAPVLERLGYS